MKAKWMYPQGDGCLHGIKAVKVYLAKEVDKEIKELEEEVTYLKGARVIDKKLSAVEIKELKASWKVDKASLKAMTVLYRAKKEQIKELKEDELQLVIWGIEQFDNRAIGKISQGDAQGLIDEFKNVNKH